MAILLPVISRTVDYIVLDYLINTNQYGDQPSTSKGLDVNIDYNQNNSNSDENNNNKTTTQDVFEGVLNWADEPWTDRDDVEIPDWAKMEDTKTDEFVCNDLVWANDPWIQTTLFGIPSWMMLPGIDYNVKKTGLVEDVVSPQTSVNDNDCDAGFLASERKIEKWSDDPWIQTTLFGIPSWMMLPGIDYNVKKTGLVEDVVSPQTSVIDNDCDAGFLASERKIEKWSDDPWIQTTLFGIPSWMMLSGIDYNVKKTGLVEDVVSPQTSVIDNDCDAGFLASERKIGNWSDDPWIQTTLFGIPSWMMLYGIDYNVKKTGLVEDVVSPQTSVNDNDCDAEFLTCEVKIGNWSDDQWIQTPMIGIPTWMMLPGIDYNVKKAGSIGGAKKVPEVDHDKIKTPEMPVAQPAVNDDDCDAEFLACDVKIGNWCDEAWFPSPLDVPRWALLPGIDFPAKQGNIPYWNYKLMMKTDLRVEFRQKVFSRKLPTLIEEQVIYNNQGQSKLFVPKPLIRRRRRF